MLYGCDGFWWKRNHGIPKFSGIKLCQDAAACAKYRDLCKVDIPDASSTKLTVEKPGVVGAGGNSGFQALNLAVQFGAMRIALVGFDMHIANGVHWHGRHGNGLNNPNNSTFMRWRDSFNGAADFVRGLGVDVVNTSLQSALTVFPRMTIEQVKERWGL